MFFNLKRTRYWIFVEIYMRKRDGSGYIFNGFLRGVRDFYTIMLYIKHCQTFNLKTYEL